MAPFGQGLLGLDSEQLRCRASRKAAPINLPGSAKASGCPQGLELLSNNDRVPPDLAANHFFRTGSELRVSRPLSTDEQAAVSGY